MTDTTLTEAEALRYRPPHRAMPELQELAQDVPPTPARAVVLACGTDLKPEPVRWLWRDWLALGKLHILAGAPGQGKTTLALGMGRPTVRTPTAPPACIRACTHLAWPAWWGAWSSWWA